ncbi:hypothetical protein K7X86_00725, partial [Candidatus Sulcia muelleri]|nr:hypothetical protein [Candidatus Karelsulcia muelleri]
KQPFNISCLSLQILPLFLLLTYMTLSALTNQLLFFFFFFFFFSFQNPKLLRLILIYNLIIN